VYFVKTNIPAIIVKEGIMKAGSLYWCSEEHIQARNKANPVINSRHSFDYGYGTFTKEGWVR
tara:strand:+ start:555 stop:740 length:186 start_codon:yes stop_codon:yes gene_type:complete